MRWVVKNISIAAVTTSTQSPYISLQDSLLKDDLLAVSLGVRGLMFHLL